MPMMQVAFCALNERFDKRSIERMQGADIAFDQPFQELTRQLLGDDLPRGFDEFAGSMPVGMQRAISAAVSSAVERGLPVTFAWAPGYDWELGLWDVADTEETHGGMTVMIRSRYPDDPHPLGSRTTGS